MLALKGSVWVDVQVDALSDPTEELMVDQNRKLGNENLWTSQS